MTTQSASPFTVTGWDATPYDEGVPGPQLFRVKVTKHFEGGDLAGDSVGELLMCVADPKNLAAGAGYVISERFTGQLAGRSGTFVLQHWGHSRDGVQQALGHVVNGSGTGDLAGLSGTMEITPDHRFLLDYVLPDG